MTRALVSLLLFLSESNPFDGFGGSSIEIIVFTVLLCFLDTHRRREFALIGNLGVKRSTLAVLFAVPAIAGEIAIPLVASIFV